MYTKKEELEIYRKALIDWERPIEEARESLTDCGFCAYFEVNYSIEDYDFPRELETLWEEGIRETDDLSAYHYSTSGDLPKGRKQRVSALKAAIKELENALKS